MNNENLKPFDQRTESEQREIRSKGGKASVQKRRELKEFKEYLKAGLKTKVKNKNGKEVTAKEAGVLKVIQKYIEGDYKFVELVLKVLNEMPTDKLEVENKGINIVVADKQHKKMLEDL